MKVRLSKFKPALGLANAHLMTLAPLAMRRTFPLTDSYSEKLVIDVDGDQLRNDSAEGTVSAEESSALTPARNQVVVSLHRPEQLQARRKNYAPLTNLSKSLIVIVHGLEGSVESTYVKGVCEKALSIGFSVCRINLRNCGDTLHLARGLYNAGMSDDVRHIAAYLKKQYAFDQIFLSGFSLGGNIVLKAAGEQGTAGSGSASALPFDLITGVCAVCPPVELDHCVSTIERGENWLYEHGFLISLKEKVKAKNRLFPGRFDIGLLPAITSLRGFDNTFTAPDAGYSDAASYYHGASSLRVISAIKIPTLIIAAEDDPLVPISSIKNEAVAANPHVTLLTAEKGGHVAFVSASDISFEDMVSELPEMRANFSRAKASKDAVSDRFWSEWQVVKFFLSLTEIQKSAP